MTSLKDLTPKFRHVRLLLAREKGHPGGEHGDGYDLLLPLDMEGRLDAACAAFVVSGTARMT